MIFIYNAERERIGILQNEESVQWLENYQAPGEVKITAMATDDNRTLLIDGNRLYNTDSDTSARISYTETVITEAEERLIIRADITSELLSDRVVMETDNITFAEAGMYRIYKDNRRGMPIETAEPIGLTDKVDIQITWNSVLDAERRIAELSGLGFKVVFVPDTGVETLTVYKGVDRSSPAHPEYIGYFGTDVGNITNVQVVEGTTEYKTVAVVAGAGEGHDRTVVIVDLTGDTGENRRELYVDARDIQQEYQVSIPTSIPNHYSFETHMYTAQEYQDLLTERGYKKLEEQLKELKISCDVEQLNIYYGVDYFLGDRIPINLPEFGMRATAMITGVTRVYESTGNRIIAILSDFELEVSV